MPKLKRKEEGIYNLKSQGILNSIIFDISLLKKKKKEKKKEKRKRKEKEQRKRKNTKRFNTESPSE